MCLITNNIVSQSKVSLLESKLDSIIQNSIDSMAFPGAQLVIATKDEIILNKAYGYHTYDQETLVEKNHLYDLASLTKVTSGLLLLMKMVDANLISLDDPISEYLPELKKSNKSSLTLRQILAHQAGLQPYIVFWQKAKNRKGQFKCKTFKTQPSKHYPIKITDNLYLHKKYRKKMVKAIKKSNTTSVDKATYKYSGLIFLLLPELIENVLKSDYHQQLEVSIYNKLKLTHTLYNPTDRHPLSQIVPTEIDTLFRKQIVHGKVHDEAAAMLDSKSCNAGLFSNAEDIASIFQMLMNDGVYKGDHIINPSTIKEFTSYQYAENRRGLGFDKPLLSYNPNDAYVAKSAGPNSFGHSGFTGTFAWADPDADIIIVLLTNRVFPYRSQTNLYGMNIRPKLHQACYDFFDKK